MNLDRKSRESDCSEIHHCIRPELTLNGNALTLEITAAAWQLARTIAYFATDFGAHVLINAVTNQDICGAGVILILCRIVVIWRRLEMESFSSFGLNGMGATKAPILFPID